MSENAKDEPAAAGVRLLRRNQGPPEIASIDGLIPRRRWGMRTAAPWLIPIALYIPLAAWGAYLHREAINPDAIAYIRRAMYLADLKLWTGISGYWSPLISWCIVPLIKMDFDGLYSARAVLAGWGMVYVAAVCWFVWRFAGLSEGLRLAVGCVVALFAAHVVTQVITPDLLLAACLFGYFALVTREDLLRNRRVQFGVGLIGGIAYLAKAYGFPFVLVHFPMTLVLRASVARWGVSDAGEVLVVSSNPRPEAGAKVGGGGARELAGEVGKAAAVGLLGLAMVAGPWIALLSVKYGEFTVTKVGRINHAVVGPPVVHSVEPEYFGVPRAPYILRHEITEEVPRDVWSPLQSGAHFRHQLGVMGRHFVHMVRTAGRLDLLWLSVVAVLALPLALRRLRRWDEPAVRVVWVVLTGCLYCSGFLFVHFETRFIEPILLPLGMLLALLVWRMLVDPAHGPAPGRRRARVVGQGVILLSFAAMMLWHLSDDLAGSRRYPYRALAEQIKELGISGPIASTHKRDGMYLAYHLDLPFAGFPKAADAEEAEHRLRGIGMGALVLWRPHRSVEGQVLVRYDSEDQLANELVRRPNWRRVRTIKISPTGAVQVWVYRPPKARPSHPA